MDANYQPKRPGSNRHIDGFVRPPQKRRITPNQIPLPPVKKAIPSVARQPKQLDQPSMLNRSIPAAHDEPLVRGSRRDRSRKRIVPDFSSWFSKRRVITGLLILVLILVGAGGWDVWQLDHKVNHLAVQNLTTSVGGAENILVAGSTNRCNLKVQNAEWGFCSQGVTGVNSDIIFVVHIVPSTKTVSILSIPRDTFVPNARSGDEAFKIDAALYQGPTQLVNAIQEDFGIPIQHYAEVGFDGFVNIVNAVGGIKMNFPMPVYDSESYLDIKAPGCQLLNGVEALQVVRARHLQYDPPSLKTSDVNLWPQETESDIARITRTHEFLRVLGSTVLAKGLGNPVTDQKLVDAIAPQVQVDSGLSTAAMIQLAQALHAVNINNVPQYTLPVSTTNFGTYYYDDSSYGDVVFPAEANDQRVINQFLGVTNSTDTMTGRSLPKANTINVSVVNGSGISDQASQTATALQVLGFQIAGTPTSQTPLSEEALETVVAYASSATEADAEAVSRELTGPVILSENASLVPKGANVAVITGTGLAVNALASTSSAANSSSTQSASTASTTSQSTINSTSSSELAAPSAANQALSPWDPRACSQ